MNVLKLGIVGNGFVGSAVSNGFDVDTEQFIVDPKQNNNTIGELIEFDPKLVFVCVPTPPQDSHYDVDVQIVDSVLKDLHKTDYELFEKYDRFSELKRIYKYRIVKVTVKK